MAVHGGIDGFSRVIVYLSCSTNNEAKTVYHLFKKAVYEYGCPSRVRSDKGRENVMVCRYMVATRGTGRASHIAQFTINELSVCGEMSTDVFVQHIMTFFTRWKV